MCPVILGSNFGMNRSRLPKIEGLRESVHAPGFHAMQRLPEPVEAQTLELCKALVHEPEFPDLYRKVERYLADVGAQFQLNQLQEVNQLLQHKQSMGAELSAEEIEHYEKIRQTVVESEVIRDFLDAEEKIQSIQNRIHRFLMKTFEVGRVPIADDFFEETCNSGCGGHL